MEIRTTPKGSHAFEARKGPRGYSRDKFSAKFDPKIKMALFSVSMGPKIRLLTPLKVGDWAILISPYGLKIPITLMITNNYNILLLNRKTFKL